MYLSTDIHVSTLHLGDLAWCILELLSHVVIRHLCVAWSYVTAAKPTLDITYHPTDHTVTLQMPYLPKLVLR